MTFHAEQNVQFTMIPCTVYKDTTPCNFSLINYVEDNIVLLGWFFWINFPSFLKQKMRKSFFEKKNVKFSKTETYLIPAFYRCESDIPLYQWRVPHKYVYSGFKSQLPIYSKNKQSLKVYNLEWIKLNNLVSWDILWELISVQI